MQVELAVKPKDLAVDIGFPCGTETPSKTTLSLLKTVMSCLKTGIPIDMAWVMGSSLAPVARDRVVDKFLQGSATRLFWIDSDIVWEPSDFVRLLMLTTEVDVVCAAYPLKDSTQNLVIKHPDLRTFHLNKYGLVKINGTGLGFCCMKREVVERIAETKPVVYDAAQDVWTRKIFRLDTITDDEGRLCGRGEDMAFFADIEELGYDVWLDPTIKLGHVGAYEYRSDPMSALGIEKLMSAAIESASERHTESTAGEQPSLAQV
jgi:hypothetical protein